MKLKKNEILQELLFWIVVFAIFIWFLLYQLDNLGWPVIEGDPFKPYNYEKEM